MRALKRLGKRHFDRLAAAAAAAPRRRCNLNLHPGPDDPVQRLFNALEPGTYVRPHRHSRDDGWEFMLAVSGAFSLLVFDDSGQVTERVEVAAGSDHWALEVPPYTWHGVVAQETRSLLFELKPGPYVPLEDKDFAPWSAVEGSARAAAFLAWLQQARPGDSPPR